MCFGSVVAVCIVSYLWLLYAIRMCRCTDKSFIIASEIVVLVAFVNSV